MNGNRFWLLLYSYAGLMIVGLALLYITGYPTHNLIEVALGMSMVYISILMVWSTLKTAEATKYVGELGIKPLLIAFIRPASAYTKELGRIHDWLPGVGIFVENIGNGPAINGRIICTLSREKEKRTYEMNFNRMRAGQRYTYPSRNEPNLEIKDTDQELEIEIEYDDAIRKHHKEEPTKITLIEKYFERSEGDIRV